MALVVGGALRGTGVGYGEGVVTHVDEAGIVAALDGIRTHQPLTPFMFFYGGGYLYPMYAFVALAQRVALPAGAIEWREPAGHAFHVLARSWSTVTSTATIALVYVLGGVVGGTAPGVLAAVLMAGMNLAVREAHIAKADSAAAFAATLFLLVAVWPSRRARLRSIPLGVAGGYAVATKLQIGLMPAFVLAALSTPSGEFGRTTIGDALLAATTAVVTFFVFNPLWLLQPARAMLLGRVLYYAQSHVDWLPGGSSSPGPVAFHATVSLWYGCGAAIAILAAPAVAAALWSGGARRLIAVGVLGQWAALTTSRLVFSRYFLPSVPGLLVLIAVLVSDLAGRATLRPGLRAALVAAVGFVLLAEPAWNSVMVARLMARDDTRVEAGRWIAAHAPPNAPVVVWGAPPTVGQFGAPPLGTRLRWDRLPIDEWSAKHVQMVVHHRYPIMPSSDPLPPLPADFALAASFDPFDGTAVHPVLDPLDSFYLPLARFRGVERPGPHVDVYLRRPEASAVPGARLDTSVGAR